MIEPNLNVTSTQVRIFGLMLMVFATALGAVTLWRSEAILGAATFLGVAWLISFALNRQNWKEQLAGVLLPAICTAVVLPLWAGTDPWIVAGVVWIGGLVLGLLAVGLPVVGRAIYVGWMMSAVPVGWTFSHLILAVVYYLILTPIALIVRLCGHDPMQRKILPDEETYWMEHPSRMDSREYFRQF